MISVVIPTYNRPSLLKNCISSLCDQTLGIELYEIIIVSDGPDKESKKVVLEFAEKHNNIIYLSLPEKKGPAAARNLGWQNAKGVLIAFTDDDCLPDALWLDAIWKHYKNEPEVAFTGKVVVPTSDDPTDFELNIKGLETGDFVTANCVVTKATLQAIGGFDENFTLAWREDSDLEFKLLQRQVPITRLEDAIVFHPARKAPWGVSIKEQRKTMFNALLFKKYPELYRQRIRKQPLWKYYFTLLFFFIFITSVLLSITTLSIIAFVGWLLLTIQFIYRRLAATRKSAGHIFEMIATSILIPFLSIYWTIYGSIKFKVLFF
jgi:glycosyltransferase involved in cell wall biosynthesis